MPGVNKNLLNEVFCKALQINIFKTELGEETEGGEVEKWRNQNYKVAHSPFAQASCLNALGREPSFCLAQSALQPRTRAVQRARQGCWREHAIPGLQKRRLLKPSPPDPTQVWAPTLGPEPDLSTCLKDDTDNVMPHSLLFACFPSQDKV